MEYDRALFRVYERILEDLNASPSPIAAYTASARENVRDASAAGDDSVPVRRNRRRGRNDGRNDDGEENDVPASEESGAAENHGTDGDVSRQTNSDSIVSNGDQEGENRNLIATNSNDSSERRSQRRRRGRRRREQTTQQQFGPNITMPSRQLFSAQNTSPIPFFLPIWLSLKVDRVMTTFYDRRMMYGDNTNYAWAIFRRGTNLFRRNNNEERQQMQIPSTPTRYRSLLVHTNSPSFNHADSDAESDLDVEHVGESDALNLPRLSPGNENTSGLRRRTASNSSPSRSSPPNSPSIRSGSSVGSRSSSARIASPPLSPRSSLLHPRTSPSPSLSSSTASDLAYTSSSSEEGLSNNEGRRSGTGAGTATSLTQRAIQMQMRQNERLQSFSSRRSSNRRDSDSEGDDSSSDSESLDDDSTQSSANAEGDSHNEGCSQMNLYRAMRFTFGLGVFHLFVLMALHVTYVGPYAFERQKVMTDSALVTKLSFWRKLLEGERQLEGGNINSALSTADKESETHDYLVNCISKALSTRPPKDRSRYHILFGNDESKDETTRSLRKVGSMFDFGIDDGYLPLNTSLADADIYYYDDDPWQNRILEDKQPPQLPLIGKDEILQIKILYGGKCIGQCSRVRYVQYPVVETDSDKKRSNSNKNNTQARLFPQRPAQSKVNDTDVKKRNNSPRGREKRVLMRRLQNKTSTLEHANGTQGTNSQSASEANPSTQNQSVDELSSPEYWQDPSYRFALDDALLYLDEKSIYLHNITIVNVTVTERCLSTGSDNGELSFLTATGEFLSQIYGMDSIIINQLMFGIRNVDDSHLGGHVQNMETKERWGWRADQVENYDGKSSIFVWISKKLGMLFMSLLAFFLITSVTSLIVRVLTSSGVVLMFPLFELFRTAGIPGADERILALSYPWIGVARRAIRSNHVHPQSHLVWAHMTKIVLYYVMYEACQAAWSVVLYAKSIPEALPVWIYGLAMITEYFSMVFVRSAVSVHFFPRITLLYFLLYHFYFYSVSYGYFDLALIPLSLFMMHAMLFTVFLEAPNAARGTISVECPREVFNKLSWTEWNAQLPSEWTIFLPLNSRQTPLHDQPFQQINPAREVAANNNASAASSSA